VNHASSQAAFAERSRAQVVYETQQFRNALSSNASLRRSMGGENPANSTAPAATGSQAGRLAQGMTSAHDSRASGAAAGEPWPCQRCTFMNEAGSVACSICGWCWLAPGEQGQPQRLQENRSRPDAADTIRSRPCKHCNANLGLTPAVIAQAL